MATIMRQIAIRKLTTVFWLLVLSDIIAVSCHFKISHIFLKALLVPVLILLLSTAGKSTGKKLLLTGLIFSWLGDMFLLHDKWHQLFFIFGLVSFLITHIFYIIYFLQIKSTGRSLLLKQPWIVLIIPGYGLGLVCLLFPHLGDLMIPVIIYAVIICTMLLCSFHIFYKVKKRAGYLFWMGAGAFVISDSILAINRFYQTFAFAGGLIMLTYCLAQYLIVRGFLEEEGNKV